MPDGTDIPGLPLILPARARKHVTHNEALLAPGAIVQLAGLVSKAGPVTLRAMAAGRWI